MRTSPLRRIALLSTGILLAAFVGAYASPSLFQTGLTISKPGAQPGLIIFAAPDGFVYAVDAAGNVVQKWSSPEPGTTLGYTRPLPNGNLLGRLQPVKGAAAAAGEGYAEASKADSVIEFTQEGKVVWKYVERDRSLHHEQERLPNGDTLLVCAKEVNAPAISKKLLHDDCLIEVDKTGKVVWEWQTADHWTDLDLSASAKAKIMEGPQAQKTRLAVGAPPEVNGFDWGHMNAASVIPEIKGNTDPRFRAGNIIASYRNLNTLAVIDRDSKKIVWTGINMTIGQHNVHFIPDGLPGAGHILVFDNGNNSIDGNPRVTEGRPNSRAVEIDPHTNSEVWEYDAEKSHLPIWTFYSHYISSVQRQPNGNTLICEGSNGRFFEVTRAGEIVWEYVNPFVKGGKNPDSTVYRVAKVPENWLKRKN